MRISSSSIFNNGTLKITELQAALMKSQQQIASGKRILTAADDPVAAARALEVTQGQVINNQLAVNRKTVQSNLSQEENELSSVTSLLQDVKTLAVNAGDAATDTNQLRFMASELQGKFEELLGHANSRDAIGNFVFSGYQTNTQPFANTPGGVSFVGDNGMRMMQVGTTRQMAMSDSGLEVFGNIANGNGRFVTNSIQPATNTGSATISPGTVVGTMSTDDYQIVFSNPTGTQMVYSVFNTTQDPTMAGAPESTGNYVDGQTITFDNGARQVEIKGTPNAGDAFTSVASTKQSMFTTLQNLITALQNVQNNPAGRTELTNTLSLANQNIDNAIDHVLTIRADVGSRLKEIDNLDNDGDNKNLVFAQTLRDLTDLDYVKAISDLNQQTMTLQAAQQSFVKVSGLSVFNYL